MACSVAQTLHFWTLNSKITFYLYYRCVQKQSGVKTKAALKVPKRLLFTSVNHNSASGSRLVSSLCLFDSEQILGSGLKAAQKS